jgi:TetR/AcrR family transcriptional repressor of nem operon
MGRKSNRHKILAAGVAVVHEHGLAGSSVRDIVEAAGVPQGSFTNHFVSKEHFVLEVLDLYFDESRLIIADTLLNDELPPLARLRRYIELNRDFLLPGSMQKGCMLGNLTAEASFQSEMIRERLNSIYLEIKGALEYCLGAAVVSKDLPQSFDVKTTAGYILSGMQGALLLSKSARDSEPLDTFMLILFSSVLA